MDKSTQEFIRLNSVSGILRVHAERLRQKAQRLEALAAALPENLGSEAAETAMRELIIRGTQE